jgi:hypothetical protein
VHCELHRERTGIGPRRFSIRLGKWLKELDYLPSHACSSIVFPNRSSSLAVAAANIDSLTLD